jgi:hypothetical protein
MKITHRNPAASFWRIPESDPVDPAYEAEVRACTERGEREHQRLQDRLARGEAKLARATAHARTRRGRQQVAVLTALVEIRRAELEDYQRTMVAVGASAVHRGTKSFRPVPERHGSGL